MGTRRPADDVLLTRREAAKWFKVTESTIWSWGQRFGLRPINRIPPYRYRFGDLTAADRRARESGMGRPRRG